MILSLQPNEASALKARQVGAAAHMSASGPTSTLVSKIVTLAGGEPSPAPKTAPAAAAPAAAQPASPPVAEPASVSPPAGQPAAAPQPASPNPGEPSYGVPQPVGGTQATAQPQPRGCNR